MSQTFVHKTAVGITSAASPGMKIAEVVHQAIESPFLDCKLQGMMIVLMNMASIMQEGEQVRLAELLHHVPVAVPFVGTAPEHHPV